ncbi:hypothetical protein J2Y48_004480 [Mycoplana sp. BE70]|nr:hypothetical protein [Mycoplana sp. BE70]
MLLATAVKVGARHLCAISGHRTAAEKRVPEGVKPMHDMDG